MKKHLLTAFILASLAAPSWQASAQEAHLLPYHKDLKSTTALDDMTVIDANNDGKTWTASVVGARYNYHRNNAGDDWLITPGLRLEAGKGYDLTAILGSYNKYNEEKYEICLGTAPTAEAMTIQVVPPTATTTCYKDNPEVKGTLEVPGDGVYYVGIHCISDKNKMSLYCVSIDVEQGYAPSAPGALQDVSVKPEPTGEFYVDIAFKAPLVNNVGKPMEGKVSVSLLRDGQELKAWTLDPGAGASFRDETHHRGMFTYQLLTKNEAGEEGAPFVAEKVYVGPYAPVTPGSVRVVETEPGVVKVSWDPVTKDIKGTDLKAENITYRIYTPSATGSGYSTTFLEDFPETEKTIVALKDASKQSFVSYCVVAYNHGQASEYGPLSELLALGAVTKVPALYSGDNNVPFGSDKRGGVEWASYSGLDNVSSQDSDGLFYAGVGSEYGQYGDLVTAKIDLAGAEGPQLQFFNYCLGDNDRNTLTVYAQCDGQLKEIAKVDHSSLPTAEWSKTRVSLGEFAGKTIQLVFRAKCLGISHTLLDNITVSEAPKYDLVAQSATAPSHVTTDEPFTIVCTVLNDGGRAVESASVVLSRDGKEIAANPVIGIEPGASTTTGFEQTLSLFNEPEVVYSIRIEFPDDENQANNSYRPITVKRSVNEFDGVTDLRGEAGADGVVLTWKGIDTANPQSMRITDDLESAEPFADSYGDWTFIDRDGMPIGPMIEGAGYNPPGHAQGSPAGFFVWDTKTSRFAGPNNAFSGTKYFASCYRKDFGAIDDWAISPLLSGRAQTVSFMANAFDDNNGTRPEQIQIWYATEDTSDPDKFVQLKEFGNNGTYKVYTVRESGLSAYSLVEAGLPAGARRFAIRSVAADTWQLMIDDISYAPDASVSPLVHLGYNVYCDGSRLNADPVAGTTYLAEVAEGVHTFRVSAVYEPGESELSAPATVDSTTGIESVSASSAAVIRTVAGHVVVSGLSDAPYAVFTPEGRLVARGVGEAAVALRPGLYVVVAGPTTAKVVVR